MVGLPFTSYGTQAELSDGSPRIMSVYGLATNKEMGLAPKTVYVLVYVPVVLIASSVD